MQVAGVAIIAPGYLLVCYEDFVNSPRPVVMRIVPVIGQGSVRARDIGTVEIPTSHAISVVWIACGG